MPADADAARFFAADEYVLGQHQLAHMLEADAVLVELAAVPGRNPVQHLRCIEGARNASGPLLALEQPLEQQAVDFIGIDELAFLVHRADTVSIAIGCKPGVAAVL